MTTINCIYDCKFQKDGVCNLSSESRIVNSNSSIGCPYFIEREKNESISAKEPKQPPSHFLLR